MKRLILMLTVLSLTGWGAYKLWPRKAGETATYEAVKVTRGDLARSVQASGTVAPENRVDLRPPFAGRLEEVLVQEGEPVKKGQIVAWLSSAERAALLDAASARGAKELKKWQGLYRATPMLSPISGTLIARNFEAGQSVSPSDAVVSVSDRLIIKTSVDETDIAQVAVSQSARLTLDAYPNKPFEGTVVHVAYEAVVVSNVTNYTVKVAPDEAPDFMRSGMTASVELYTETRSDVLQIPSEAIQPRKEGQGKLAQGVEKAGERTGERKPRGHGRRGTVLMPAATKNGAKIEKEIQLGLSDGKFTEVIEGLAEGDTVLLKTVSLPSAAAQGKNPFAPQRSTTRMPRAAR